MNKTVSLETRWRSTLRLGTHGSPERARGACSARSEEPKVWKCLLEPRLQRHQVKTPDVIIGVDTVASQTQRCAAVRAFRGDLDAEVGRELLGHAGKPADRPESRKAIIAAVRIPGRR